MTDKRDYIVSVTGFSGFDDVVNEFITCSVAQIADYLNKIIPGDNWVLAKDIFRECTNYLREQEAYRPPMVDYGAPTL